MYNSDCPFITIYGSYRKLMLRTFKKQGKALPQGLPEQHILLASCCPLCSWQKCHVLLHDDCMPDHVTRTPHMSYHVFPIMGDISHCLVDEGKGCAPLFR